jgi:hypothetical protein
VIPCTGQSDGLLGKLGGSSSAYYYSYSHNLLPVPALITPGMEADPACFECSSATLIRVMARSWWAGRRAAVPTSQTMILGRWIDWTRNRRVQFTNHDLHKDRRKFQVESALDQSREREKL